jgi:hypothetical protein
MASQGDRVVATEAGSSVAIARSEAKARPNIAGFVATACIVCLFLLLALTWPVGAVGDLLLGGALIGLLFRIPHTVAIWAALTLLVLTAFVLSIHDSALAESFANLVYYGLTVGCLWAIWNMVAERFRWNMPATVLFEYAKRRMKHHFSPPLAAIGLALALAIVGAFVTGTGAPAVGFLAFVAVFGLFRRPRSIFVLACGMTLAVLAILQAIAGRQSLAILTGLLAGGSIVMAPFWFVGRTLLARFIRHDSARLLVVSTAGNSREGASHDKRESEQILADV